MDEDLRAFYGRLLGVVARDVFRDGEWRLCDRSGWPDNQTFRSVLAWCWSKAGERYLVVINFGQDAAQARVRVPWEDLGGRTWRLIDTLAGGTYDRHGDEMLGAGLYVDLAPWQCHLFRLEVP